MRFILITIILCLYLTPLKAELFKPNPSISPEEVISIQLSALQKNSIPFKAKIFNKNCRITITDTGLKTLTGGRLKRMKKYFRELDGEKATNIYHMVLKEVEQPLLETVMKECNGNQTLASQVLGLNRGTLRTKLKDYNLI